MNNSIVHNTKKENEHTSERAPQSRCTLHVCTSCRIARTPREPKENRQGFQLYHDLREAISMSPLKECVDVKPAACLSLCPRPCAIAISSSESWTYLFGDQVPTKTTADIIECLSSYLNAPNGFMTREERPKYLRRSILGRVPPIKEGPKCT